MHCVPYTRPRAPDPFTTTFTTFARIVCHAASLLLGIGGALAEDAHVKPVTAYVVANIRPWLSDPAVVDAIKAQNIANAKLKNNEINTLDNGWIEKTNPALIESKMHNDLSTFLRKKKENLGPIIVEIFVFDKKGLNVGQTDMTQDYNQGDEAKYWRTYKAGPDAIYIDEVELDDGKNVSQASLTIKDPETGKAIGAVTVGIDVDKLK